QGGRGRDNRNRGARRGGSRVSLPLSSLSFSLLLPPLSPLSFPSFLFPLSFPLPSPLPLPSFFPPSPPSLSPPPFFF
ncbi:hypothetical protein ACXWR7_13790, partial [Streptococcus pyogenes]